MRARAPFLDRIFSEKNCTRRDGYVTICGCFRESSRFDGVPFWDAGCGARAAGSNASSPRADSVPKAFVRCSSAVIVQNVAGNFWESNSAVCGRTKRAEAAAAARQLAQSAKYAMDPAALKPASGMHEPLASPSPASEPNSHAQTGRESGGAVPGTKNRCGSRHARTKLEADN